MDDNARTVAGSLGINGRTHVLSTVLAYIVYFRIFASAGATNALLVTFLVPVSALVLGALVLRERISLTDVTGRLPFAP